MRNKNKEVSMEKYTTYENKPNKRICIHKLSCIEVRKNGGQGQGLYKEFNTLNEAIEYAKTLPYSLSFCSRCNVKND